MTEVAAATEASMTFPRRLANILGLSMGWCLMVSVMFIQLSTTTLAAKAFGGSATATLPAGIMMAAAAASMTPGALLMQRLGRKPLLLASGLGGMVGGAMLTLAARFQLLWLLVVGSIPLGVCFALANNLRFAATEFAPTGFEPQALSLVVTGAVLAAVVGPEVGKYTRHAMEPPYTATYLFVTGLCALYTGLMAVVAFQALPGLAAAKAAAAAAAATAAADAAAAAAAGKPAKPQVQAAKTAAAGIGPAAAVEGYKRSGTAGSALSRASSLGDPLGAPPVREEQGGGGGGRPGAGRAGGGELPAGGASAGSVFVLVAGGQPEDGDVGGRAAGDGGGLMPPKSYSGSSDGASEGPSGAAVAPPPVGGRGALRRLFLSWDYAVPVITASLSYCGMAGMMTASPLAINDANYSFDETTQVIQVHIISMFLPSLLTGHVIAAISALWTMTLGSVALLGGTAVFFAGPRLPVFFAGNAVVGLGWNWAYVGASALVATVYAPETRFVAQGCMDTAVLLGTGVSVVLAGTLYSGLGWRRYTAIFMAVSGAMVAIDAVLLLVHARRAASGARRLRRGRCG